MGLTEHKKSNREKIIEAALKLFSKKGIRDTTLLDIADEAKVARKTVLNIFGSKDYLIFLVMEQATAQALTNIKMIEKSREYQRMNGLDQVYRMLVARAKYLREHPYVVTLMNEAETLVAADKINMEDYRRYLKKTYWLTDVTRRALDKGIMDGSIRKDIDKDEAEIFLIVSFRAIAVRLLQIQKNKEVSKYVDVVDVIRKHLAVVKRYLTH